MNLEHTRMIPATDMGRLTPTQLMVEFVERENVYRRAVDRITAHCREALDDTARNEYAIALLAVNKEFVKAKLWADHYRTKVREELRESTCANEEVPS
jgi:hypothetical protein